MKKQFTPFLFLLIGLTTYAHPNNGVISITNLSRQHIVIEVDGLQFTDCKNVFTIRDVVSGFHMVKVYGERMKTGNSNIDKQPVIFSSNMYVKRDYYIDIIINRFGRALTDEQLIIDDRYDDCDINTVPKTDNNFIKPVTDETFAQLKETITNETFDDSRMTIAKSIIDQNYFTAAQAKQLTQLFAFESNKLAIAKYLFSRTTDRKNYFIVYSAFTFSKTKEELAEFIRNYK